MRPVQAGISCADQGHGATRGPEQSVGESCLRGAGRGAANSRPLRPAARNSSNGGSANAAAVHVDSVRRPPSRSNRAYASPGLLSPRGVAETCWRHLAHHAVVFRLRCTESCVFSPLLQICGRRRRACFRRGRVCMRRRHAARKVGGLGRLRRYPRVQAHADGTRARQRGSGLRGRWSCRYP